MRKTIKFIGNIISFFVTLPLCNFRNLKVYKVEGTKNNLDHIKA